MHDEWGIADGYWDVAGTWRPTSDATRDRLRETMGDPSPGPGPWFVREGSTDSFWNPCDLHLEDGTVRADVHGLPGDLPIGYHRLVPRDGAPSTELIVHPAACPELPTAWGLGVQIYSLWSERSWGVGDLRDLRTVCDTLALHGGGAVLISPLHQPALTLPVEPSPYYPSTRRAWSPLLLAMDDEPPEELRCRPDALIDRDAVWTAKRDVLLARFGDLDDGSIEPSSVSWWNAEMDARSADEELSPAQVARLARFHEWLQLLVGEQLAAVAATGIAIIGDLAVGFAPGGADADEYAEVLAGDMRLGAPPDPFNQAGQGWGIPPFIPGKLRAAAYRPFVETVRAALRGVQGLRIDHVMGLFRQFWIPEGGDPSHGAYVQFPAEDLLAIICLEATRAGAFVIGEDLGTVADGVREMLAERRIACTKVLWFEDMPPSGWPEQSLATITTHDLPTITGVFEDRDGDDEMRDRLEAVAPGAPRASDAIETAHAALLASPARIRLLAADDVVGAARRPNMPGLNDYPCWRIPLPVPVVDLLDRLAR